jgi:hypothetical protein
MYTVKNYKTKSALREAVKGGEQVEVFQPGGFFPASRDGRVTLEGPHFPAAHTWYAQAEIEDGVIVKVR